ncbi:MAG: rod shape-determining protein MreD [Schleiferiaceae bacterium]|nr:rod shape-determining protein MreD [Schleiferiaceae bacterium]
MNNSTPLFFIKLAILLIFQVFVLNNIQLMGYLNPYYYLVLILFAPLRFSQVQLLFLGFFVGLFVDWFENSGGLHASASVLLAFVRPTILRLISTKGDLDANSFSLSALGFGKYSLFALSGIFVHHFTLFLLESFKFVEVIAILTRTVTSGIFTFVMVLIFEILFSKKD